MSPVLVAGSVSSLTQPGVHASHDGYLSIGEDEVRSLSVCGGVTSWVLVAYRAGGRGRCPLVKVSVYPLFAASNSEVIVLAAMIPFLSTCDQTPRSDLQIVMPLHGRWQNQPTLNSVTKAAPSQLITPRNPRNENPFSRASQPLDESPPVQSTQNTPPDS